MADTDWLDATNDSARQDQFLALFAADVVLGVQETRPFAWNVPDLSTEIIGPNIEAWIIRWNLIRGAINSP